MNQEHEYGLIAKRPQTIDMPDSDVVDELDKLAIQGGLYSRFKIDPHFKQEQFERLYKLWMENSINKKIADDILIIRKNDAITGMVTVGKKNEKGIIGLIAVDSKERGKGLGTLLIDAAKSWFVAQGCQIAIVVTQGRNKAACKLYEKCGFHVSKIENYYHFWL